MRDKVTCVACKATSEFERTSNVGDMERRSGFRAVFTHNGITFLCSACVAKLKPHVQAIADAFGEDAADVSWYAMMRSILR